MTNLRSLAKINFIELIDLDYERQFEIRATQNGQLMARYCVAFETMRSFFELSSGDGEDGQCMKARSLSELIALVSASQELSDIKLSTNEKTLLYTFNNNGKVSKDDDDAQAKKNIVRYILEGEVKTPDMKSNM